MKKLLLSQDDCAPDSLKYFRIQMLDKYNLTFKNFYDFGEKIPDGLKYGKYHLEISEDDPFYKLYIEENEHTQLHNK